MDSFAKPDFKNPRSDSEIGHSFNGYYHNFSHDRYWLFFCIDLANITGVNTDIFFFGNNCYDLI